MQRSTCLLRLSTVTTPSALQSRLVHHHRERGNIKQFLGLFKSRKANKHFRHEWRTERARKTLNIVLPLDGPTMKKIQSAETADPAIIRQNALERGLRPIDLTPMRNYWPPPDRIAADTSGSLMIRPELKKDASFRERMVHKGQKLFVRVRVVLDDIRDEIGKATAANPPKEEFTVEKFLETAERMWCDVNEAMVNNDDERLRYLTTPMAYSKAEAFVRNGTLEWKMLERLSAPKITDAAMSRFPEGSDQKIAQVTVRLHSKQIMALYDKFGRLKLGDREKPKEAIDHIVFERLVTDPLSRWRVHAVILYDDAPPRAELVKTGTYLLDSDANLTEKELTRERKGMNEAPQMIEEEEKVESETTRELKLK